jgi:hypothetical protein
MRVSTYHAGIDMPRPASVSPPGQHVFRVGYTPQQVSTPLPRDEFPTDPNFHIMFARPTSVFTGAEG